MDINPSRIFEEVGENITGSNDIRRTLSTSNINLKKPFKSPVIKVSKSTEDAASVTSSSSNSSSPTFSGPSLRRPRSAPLVQSPLSIRNNQTKRIRLSVGTKKQTTNAFSIEELRQREAQLDQAIAELESEGLLLEELDQQIDMLHRYNDIKDIAQTVIGRIAELDSVTVKSLHNKYNAPVKKD